MGARAGDGDQCIRGDGGQWPVQRCPPWVVVAAVMVPPAKGWSMRRAVETCEKDYRGGPVPRDVLRVELRWSCHPRTAHAHRWYVVAWLCWRWQRLWRWGGPPAAFRGFPRRRAVGGGLPVC